MPFGHWIRKVETAWKELFSEPRIQTKDLLIMIKYWASQEAPVVKSLPANAGDSRDV